MATLSVVIQTAKDATKFRKPTHALANAIHTVNLIKGLISGAQQGTVNIYADSADPVQASATATVVSVVAGNTITIAGTVLTAATAPANESEFITGTDAVNAAALAACINAHSVLSKIVSATSSAGVVTISCVVPGPLGNLVTVAKSGAPITISGAALSGGAGGVANAPERSR